MPQSAKLSNQLADVYLELALSNTKPTKDDFVKKSEGFSLKVRKSAPGLFVTFKRIPSGLHRGDGIRDPKLYEFEFKLRKFIRDKLFEKYGTLWMKKGIPANILKKLKVLQQKGNAAGYGDIPLINYGAPGDYFEIMKYGPSWIVFSQYFPSIDWLRLKICVELDTAVRSRSYHHHKIPADYEEKRDKVISELLTQMGV